MTDIKRKALELVNEVAWEWRIEEWTSIERRSLVEEVICRAIERHEAFRQEVSDAVEAAKRTYGGHQQAFDQLERFIIPKPDPLVEAVRDTGLFTGYADKLREAIEKRGGKIVWGEG